MASGSGSNSSKSASLNVNPGQNKASNIPGADLNNRVPSDLTKAELIRWLKCRQGASLKGKKSVLVERVNLYIQNGWDTRYLIDPENGQSQVDLDAIYSVNNLFVSRLLDNPPTCGYTNKLEDVPKIEDSSIFQYFLIKCDNSKSSAAKHRDKGWNFYMSEKVNATEFLQVDDTVVVIRGDVAASFDRGVVTGKTKKKYPVHATLDKFTGTILGGRCQCKAGFGGFCKHVAAVLFQVMDSQRKGLLVTPVKSSKTSVLQTWHQPNVKGQCLIKFADLDFETFNYERDNDASQAKRAKTNYKALKTMCPNTSDCVTVERLENFTQELSSLGVASQFVDIVRANNCKPVPVLDMTASSGNNNGSSDDVGKNTQMSPGTFQPPMFSANFNMATNSYNFYQTNVKISTLDEQQKISQSTVGQANNPNWFRERKYRITASHFKEIIRRKKFPCEKLLTRLTTTTPFTSKHTSWGKHAEPVALVQYKAKLEAEGYVVVGKDLGLIVNPRYPYLGASPDWFVTLTKDGKREQGIVEVKSLSKHANFTPQQASLFPGNFFTYENEQLKVDDNHAYYFQIQGQLSVCELQWCDLVIWTPNGMECTRLYRDPHVWDDMLPKLSSFYFNHFLPFLVKDAN